MGSCVIINDIALAFIIYRKLHETKRERIKGR